jgi:hypothetical protein
MKFVALVPIVDCVVIKLSLLVKMICPDCGASVVWCACSNAVRLRVRSLLDCVVVWWLEESAPPLERRQRSKRGARRAV